jgi:hypothetical protein
MHTRTNSADSGDFASANGIRLGMATCTTAAATAFTNTIAAMTTRTVFNSTFKSLSNATVMIALRQSPCVMAHKAICMTPTRRVIRLRQARFNRFVFYTITTTDDDKDRK